MATNCTINATVNIKMTIFAWWSDGDEPKYVALDNFRSIDDAECVMMQLKAQENGWA